MTIATADVFVPGLGGGTSRLALPGSLMAVPVGIEAALQYRDLLMNVKSWVERYDITEIDGLGDPDVRDVRDVKTDDDGEIPQNSFYGGRTLVINGTIRAYSPPKLRDMQMALRSAFVDIKNEYPLRFRLGDFSRDHYISCKKISPMMWSETQQDQMVTRDFQITLRASNPRFLSWMTYSNVATPSSSGSLQEIFVVTNTGNYFAQPVFRIYGPSSTTTIYNDQTNQEFTVVAIPAGDYYEYDSAAEQLRNSYQVNVWRYLADDSDTVLLASGDNHIFFSGDSPQVKVSWQNSWL